MRAAALVLCALALALVTRAWAADGPQGGQGDTEFLWAAAACVVAAVPCAWLVPLRSRWRLAFAPLFAAALGLAFHVAAPAVFHAFHGPFCAAPTTTAYALRCTE